MKFSVSQIAWESGKDPAFLDLLAVAGFHHVDIAPTKIWPDWKIANPSPAAFRQALANRGMACAGMQSIFFGSKGLNVFGDDTSWDALARHFAQVCAVAGELGVAAVVFGAPANRDPGEWRGDVPAMALDRHRMGPVFFLLVVAQIPLRSWRAWRITRGHGLGDNGG